jgi:hypothetical protein
LFGFNKSNDGSTEDSWSFTVRLEGILPLRSIGWRGEGRGEVKAARLEESFLINTRLQPGVELEEPETV